MADSLDRSGGIGFRCVAEAEDTEESVFSGSQNCVTIIADKLLARSRRRATQAKRIMQRAQIEAEKEKVKSEERELKHEEEEEKMREKVQAQIRASKTQAKLAQAIACQDVDWMTALTRACRKNISIPICFNCYPACQRRT